MLTGYSTSHHLKLNKQWAILSHASQEIALHTHTHTLTGGQTKGLPQISQSKIWYCRGSSQEIELHTHTHTLTGGQTKGLHPRVKYGTVGDLYQPGEYSLRLPTETASFTTQAGLQVVVVVGAL